MRFRRLLGLFGMFKEESYVIDGLEDGSIGPELFNQFFNC